MSKKKHKKNNNQNKPNLNENPNNQEELLEEKDEELTESLEDNNALEEIDDSEKLEEESLEEEEEDKLEEPVDSKVDASEETEEVKEDALEETKEPKEEETQDNEDKEESEPIEEAEENVEQKEEESEPIEEVEENVEPKEEESIVSEEEDKEDSSEEEKNKEEGLEPEEETEEAKEEDTTLESELDDVVEDDEVNKAKKKKKPIVVPIGSEKAYKEALEPLERIDGKYKIIDYLDSGYPFFEYDLLDVLRSDLEKCEDSDFEMLFNKVISTELAKNNEAIAMFVYFATEKDFSFSASQLLGNLPNLTLDIVYYYVALNALKYNNKQILNEFSSNIKSIDSRSFTLPLLNIHRKYRTYLLYDADDAYKSFKKVNALYKRLRRKLTEEQKRVILRDIFDIYGLSTFKKYAGGVAFYDKNQDNLDDTNKEYALLRIAHNFLIHFEFKKASKIYERILSFTSDTYNATINLMLSKNKVRIYGELTSKQKYYNTEEFNQIKDLAVKYNNKAYTDRFDKLISEITSQERYETEYKMGQIRRIVSGFCYVLMVIILILGFLIHMKSLILTEGILALIIIGVQFLTIRLKKRLVPIIVFSAIAIVFFILSIILI